MDVDEYKSIDHKFLQHAHISMPEVGQKHAIQDEYNIFWNQQSMFKQHTFSLKHEVG